jgi:ATP-dependent RNA helicase RhlE
LYKLLKKGFDVEAFHSDLEQADREKIMSGFKNKAVKILIGTDIISRGIDVVGIELVINYDTPSDPEDYVHRVGRTARADKEGEAITFVNPKDQHKFVRIEKLIGMKVTQNPLPEQMEKGPEYVGEKPRKEFPKSESGLQKNKKKKKKKKPGSQNQGEGSQHSINKSESKTSKPQNQGEPNISQTEPKTSKYGQRKNVIES